MDFTLKVYRELLATLKEGGFGFQTFAEFLEDPEERVVVLRHDVDLRPGNSFLMAQLENEMEISGTYYFRTVPESFDVEVIKAVNGLGHEVGYHYECMSTVGRGYSEDAHIDAAFEDFKVNLDRFREAVLVRTVVMHGSPRSRFNNLDIWKRHDYRSVGIIGEPYMDIDFSDVFYLTDTGRRWDGAGVSVRDRVDSGGAFAGLRFRHTRDINAAVRRGEFPSRVMINVHPQRWTGSFGPWVKELVWQNIKNQVKRFLVKA